MRKLVVTICIALAALAGSTGVSWGKELLLFSDKTFLGCLNCSKYDSDSICNDYGSYGNKYSRDSIWNNYGTYGNVYSQKSPWNPYSSSSPIIIDKDGGSYGRFSINSFRGFSQSSDLKKIYELVDGDLEKVKYLYCK